MKVLARETKVKKNYQIEIPKTIAKKLGIKEGSNVVIIYKDDTIIIKRKVKSIKNLEGKIKNLKISSKDLDKEIKNIIDKSVA